MTDFFLKIKNVLTCLACTNNKKKGKIPLQNEIEQK